MSQTLSTASKRFAACIILSAVLTVFRIPIVYAELTGSQAEDYRALGYEEQQKGNYEQALTYYTKAVSLGIDDPIIFNDVGVLYEKIGLPQKAEEFYLKAVRTKSDYLPPYTNLAFLYEAQGDTIRATAYLRERLKRAPENDPWKERLQKELIKINPSLRQTTLDEQLGKVSQQLAEEAKQKKLKELTAQLHNADKYYQTGEEYLEQKKYDLALAAFDRALTITPDNPKMIKARERVLYMQQVEKVRKRTNSALDHLESGDPDSAKMEFQKLLTTIPKEPAH